jgi:uncharacterized membrane protein YozB (DUF420 family)
MLVCLEDSLYIHVEFVKNMNLSIAVKRCGEIQTVYLVILYIHENISAVTGNIAGNNFRKDLSKSGHSVA